jgi:disulfide bond formation protein DsbB
MDAASLNLFLSAGAIVAQLISIVLLLVLLYPRQEHKARVFIDKHSLTIGFLAVLASVLGSLMYSNVIGYTPCVLCWYQRIAMYPQLVILGIAAWKKDYNSWVYPRVLSSIGIAIGIYQYYGSMFNISALPCSTAVDSCAKLYFVEFGYITIPMMSISIFAFLIILSFFRPVPKR